MATELTLTVKSDNDAFVQDSVYETVRILRQAEEYIMYAGECEGFQLKDSNGNTVGLLTYKEK